MLKICCSCQKLYPRPSTGDVGRCPTCTGEYRARQPTTTQRGLGSEWQRAARAQVTSYPWCAKCGATEDLTADHVVPRAHGGTAEHGLRTLCRSCNGKRGNRPYVA